MSTTPERQIHVSTEKRFYTKNHSLKNSLTNDSIT